MASSSSKPRKSYHVFLSFRGPDVRNQFVGHLYAALDQAGINTYKDDEKLRNGERIPDALMNAIEDSQIAIIIFSENYAFSSWCLDELTTIIECRKQKNLIVWPVFYKVEPREVRAPRESYKKALAKHKSKFGKDSEEVKRWKKALFDASFLSGEHFTDGCEAELVQQIVRKVSTQLGRTTLNATKYPVGIDSRVQKLKSILDQQSKDVLMVGLYGPGGVGKTTLAEAIYNVIFREFQGCCFLGRIKDNSHDLAPLQERLLSKLLPGDKLMVTNVGEGSQYIRERLCNKKVLIILDDIDHGDQLDALARDCEWFGKGSRIIVTTRYRCLVPSHWKDSHFIDEVKVLENGEDLELFKRHAYLSNQQIEMWRNLVDRVLHYAGGLPLALRVLGCSLRNRGEKEWEETLEKLAKGPNQEINDVLRVGWDKLEGNEKQIFLDIACFFKGERKEYITQVLSSCDFSMTIGLQHLIERSLISEEYGTLQMHDLIQSMGMDIVNKECLDYPEKRSRLWLRDDVLAVLSENRGSEITEAIVLRLRNEEKMHIGAHAFTNMRKLRLLILHNVDNSGQDPIHLPNKLRWFEWPSCATIPDFRDASKNLVGLHMRSSNFKDGLGQVKEFENLKFINLGGSLSLLHMPDISCIPNIEILILHDCKNLEHVHDSIANHRKLWRLDLANCSKLQRFPDIPNKNKSLRKIHLQKTSIEELPTSIGNLVSLKLMDLHDCEKLAILPSSIYRLHNLEDLTLSGCSQLIKFPKKDEDLSEPHAKMGFPKLSWLNVCGCHLPEVEFLENHSYFSHLRSLDLCGNNFTDLPTFEKLNNLGFLDVSDCHQLQEIPKIPKKLRRLKANRCKSLSRIPSDICDVEEDVQLYSCQELVRNGFPKNDLFEFEKFQRRICRNFVVPSGCSAVLPGGEMPNWLLPNKEGYISFVASKDLYKKIIGVAFCVVFQAERESWITFHLIGSVNCKGMGRIYSVSPCDSDNMLLVYMESEKSWTVDQFGPNDSHRFHLIIRVDTPDHNRDGKVFVKKCGFRLLSKPLENDLEVLRQDDELLDSALFYEIPHEDNPMSIEKESSSKTKDFQDSETCAEEEGLNMVDFSIEKHRYSKWSKYRNVRPGREMPKGFVLVQDGIISFMASQDLYDKFIGLYLCVVLGVEDGKKEVSFDIIPHVNSQRGNGLSGTLGSFETDHVWLQLLRPNWLWGVSEGAVDFGQFDKTYLQFSLNIRVTGATMKKLGYVMQSHPLEEALKVELEKNHLMDPASLFEYDQNPLYFASYGWKDLMKRLEYMHGERDSPYQKRDIMSGS